MTRRQGCCMVSVGSDIVIKLWTSYVYVAIALRERAQEGPGREELQVPHLREGLRVLQEPGMILIIFIRGFDAFGSTE